MNPTHTPAYDAETAALLRHLAEHRGAPLCCNCLCDLAERKDSDAPEKPDARHYRVLGVTAMCLPCSRLPEFAGWVQWRGHADV